MVGAALLLALNDHVLKGAGAVPAVATGKLSDFAGLFVLPLVLTAGTRALGWSRRRDGRELALAAAIGALFAVGKLAAWPARAAAALGIALVPDPTDLVALVSVAGSIAWLRRPAGSAWMGRATRTATVALAALACAATSRTPYPTLYGAWQVVSDQHVADTSLGCARGRVWIAKSGKQGIGVAVAATPREACRIAVRKAQLTIGTAPPIRPQALPGPLLLASDSPGEIYLPIAFDGQAAWNSGVRDGALELTFDTSAGPAVVRLVLMQKVVAWEVRGQMPP